MSTSPRVVIVTGTDTDVGKTIATAALAVHLGQPLVVKPAQTGIAPGNGEERDIDVVARLSGAPTRQFVELEDPLAPDTAARLRDVTIPSVQSHATAIRHLLADHPTVVVEGAGGLLVRLDTDGGTLLDLAADLAKREPVAVYVVTRAGLGTLNHTELTVQALRHAGLEPAGLVIGSWPSEPDQASELNRTELARVTGVPVVAVLPANAGRLAPEEFRAQAPAWFTS
ncbi:ATP-dependent dethiobiotin synthetase BioD [Nocardioides phosphati]|uniref:ATP-dependent dethiobiotin synthetase BioD n=1 Tax=Nocardioides phosphati TaxID=1867775 RepID=A0ABQ2N7V2_9ACTN|nr:dethiobiotin synthase [Nocardioides phosphati]GGO87791.1 ATP-dependent dethiobiotin synthetase BioD [Nocardioides phosphati]